MASLTVYIWQMTSRNVGHAAVSFDNNYVSFWPRGQAKGKDLIKKTQHPGVMQRSLRDDIRAEGGRMPISVTINNINVEATTREVERLINEVPQYALLRYNCSHVVANILKTATDKPQSFKLKPSEYGKLAGQIGGLLNSNFWTPAQVLRYAQELSNSQHHR